MSTIRLVLVILALVAFGLAAVGVSAPRGNLVAGGLFLWLLSELMR
jgi:hypothetical protein